MFLLILLLVVGTGIYFTPAIIGLNRDHPNSAGITILNLFLGWTLVGWVVALVWAVNAQPENRIAEKTATLESRDCPHCAESIKSAATKCKHCGSEVQPLNDQINTELDDDESEKIMRDYAVTRVGDDYVCEGYRYASLRDLIKHQDSYQQAR